MSSRAVLRSRNFRNLLAARTAVFFGNSIGVIGLAFGVLQLPGGSGAELGVVLFARSAAQIALLLVGGVFGDRYTKRRLMMTADLLAGISQLCIGIEVVAGQNNAALLALFAAVNGGATGLFLPVSTGIMPEVVEGQLFQPANAILRGTINVANIVGAAAAGLLVSTVGPGVSLIVNACAFFGSVLCLSRLRVKAAPARSGSTFLRELIDGWRTFVGYRWIWIIVADAAVINALYRGAVQVVGPVEANGQPHGPALWAIALGAQTVGLLTGSAAGLRVRTRFPLRTAMFCISLMSLPIFVLGARAPLLWMLPAMFIAGFAIDLFTILWETTLQSRVPPGALSRVSSYDALGSFALGPLGLIVAGAVVSTSIVQLLLIVAGVTALTVGLSALLVGDVRDLTDAGDVVAAK